jgi:hypothetical protein
LIESRARILMRAFSLDRFVALVVRLRWWLMNTASKRWG